MSLPEWNDEDAFTLLSSLRALTARSGSLEFGELIGDQSTHSRIIQSYLVLGQSIGCACAQGRGPASWTRMKDERMMRLLARSTLQLSMSAKNLRLFCTWATVFIHLGVVRHLDLVNWVLFLNSRLREGAENEQLLLDLLKLMEMRSECVKSLLYPSTMI